MLFLGLMYHLINPVQVFERIANATERLLCIHTFTQNYPRPSFCLEMRNLARPQGIHGLGLVPSETAIKILCLRFGFDSLYRMDVFQPFAHVNLTLFKFYFACRTSDREVMGEICKNINSSTTEIGQLIEVGEFRP